MPDNKMPVPFFFMPDNIREMASHVEDAFRFNMMDEVRNIHRAWEAFIDVTYEDIEAVIKAEEDEYKRKYGDVE